MASDLFTLKPKTQSVRPKDHVGQFLRSGEPVSDQDGGRTVSQKSRSRINLHYCTIKRRVPPASMASWASPHLRCHVPAPDEGAAPGVGGRKSEAEDARAEPG